MAPLTRVVLTATMVVMSQGALPAQSTLSYYFAHIAADGVWRTTFTYVNASTLPVSCTTNFYSDSGTPLALQFNGNSTRGASPNETSGEGLASATPPSWTLQHKSAHYFNGGGGWFGFSQPSTLGFSAQLFSESAWFITVWGDVPS